jgi:hypothetical protein
MYTRSRAARVATRRLPFYGPLARYGHAAGTQAEPPADASPLWMKRSPPRQVALSTFLAYAEVGASLCSPSVPCPSRERGGF